MVKQQSNMMVINVIWPGIVAELLLAPAAKAEGKPLAGRQKKDRSSPQRADKQSVARKLQ